MEDEGKPISEWNYVEEYQDIPFEEKKLVEVFSIIFEGQEKLITFNVWEEGEGFICLPDILPFELYDSSNAYRSKDEAKIYSVSKYIDALKREQK